MSHEQSCAVHNCRSNTRQVNHGFCHQCRKDAHGLVHEARREGEAMTPRLCDHDKTGMTPGAACMLCYQESIIAHAKVSSVAARYARDLLDEIVWLVQEVERLRGENERAVLRADAAERLAVELRARLDDPALLEALSAVEHERWAGWEKYREAVLSKSHDPRHPVTGEQYSERWRRLRDTPYAELSEAEKESDRVEARKGLEVIRAAIDIGEKP